MVTRGMWWPVSIEWTSNELVSSYVIAMHEMRIDASVGVCFYRRDTVNDGRIPMVKDLKGLVGSSRWVGR